MMETFKQIGVGLAVIVVVCAGMLWVTLGPEVKAEANRQAEARGWREPWPVARRVGLGAVFHDSADQYVSCSCTIDPKEHGVADTQVTKSYSFSCTLRVMNQDLSPMMISAATKELNISLASMMFTLVDYTTRGGWPDGTVPDGKAPGADGFVYLCSFGDAYSEYWEFTGEPTWLWVGDDTGWAGEVSISVTSTASQLARTRDVTTHMGSDGGPTHSSELRCRDGWNPGDQMCTEITFGGLRGITTPENLWSHPAPTSPFAPNATLHKSIGEHDVTYGRFENIQVSNIPLQLDGLSKKAAGAEYYLVGNGANIDLESRGFHVGDVGLGGAISPPFMLDLTQIGLCDWGETSHNDRYDNVLVWLHDGNAVCPCWQSATCICPAPPGFWPRSLGAGINPLDCYCPFCGSQLRPHGMKRVSYIPAAWPDTSETDWVSTGPFEECTACPLPIGELRRIFSPYVQRFAPYAGWQRTDGAKCELWSGHIGFLLDRTSLRANNLSVSA